MDFKKLFGKEEVEDDYIEIDLAQGQEKDNKVLVRPFTLRQFDDVNEILNALREGYTIAVIDIKPLKTKDIIELKRSVSKIKKTVDALEGNITGFGENTVIATPQFADIYKAAASVPKEKTDFIGEA
jgi:SepF-like predicted cell division protein (DUF552 family)